LIINEKPRKKAEDSSELYLSGINTPSTRKNNRRTQKDGNHKIYKLISKQPSAHFLVYSYFFVSRQNNIPQANAMITAAMFS